MVLRSCVFLFFSYISALYYVYSIIWSGKTEFIVVGSKQQRSKVNITQFTMVIPTDSVTNLGVIVDEILSMDEHIAKCPELCVYQSEILE